MNYIQTMNPPQAKVKKKFCPFQKKCRRRVSVGFFTEGAKLVRRLDRRPWWMEEKFS